MSELIPFIAGAVVALVAQYVTHRLARSREARSDLVTTLDRAVSAFAQGERVLDDLIDATQDAFDHNAWTANNWPSTVPAALEVAEAVRTEMRAAVFSLRVRLGSQSSVRKGFESAWDGWESGFLRAKVTIREDHYAENLARARSDADRFRGEFYDVAMEEAEHLLAGTRRWTFPRLRLRRKDELDRLLGECPDVLPHQTD